MYSGLIRQAGSAVQVYRYANPAVLPQAIEREIVEPDMKEAAKSFVKFCPTCKKKYPPEDSYCGEDGSQLQEVEAGKPAEKSSGKSQSSPL
jgi:hypothetical protein